MKYLLTILTFLTITASAQDTTITVRTYPCDSVVTTPLPQQLIHVRDTIIIIPDTSYNVFFNTNNTQQ
jgi:hypothetical protein